MSTNGGAALRPKTVLVGVDLGDASVPGASGRPPVVAPVRKTKGRQIMTIERSLRLIAGAFVAASVLLGIYVNPLFHWFTLFVGLNLFQSAFTQWCPMMAVLRKAGVRA
jgi:hypothetical protein